MFIAQSKVLLKIIAISRTLKYMTNFVFNTLSRVVKQFRLTEGTIIELYLNITKIVKFNIFFRFNIYIKVHFRFITLEYISI